MGSLQLDLDLVDNLSFWLSFIVRSLEFERGWKHIWQFELELDAVVSNLEEFAIRF